LRIRVPAKTWKGEVPGKSPLARIRPSEDYPVSDRRALPADSSNQ
jgi:hypothetical protein